MAVSTIRGAQHYADEVTFANAKLNAGAITNTHVGASADIAATKVESRTQIMFSQESATTATSVGRCIHIVEGATGTIMAFDAGSVVANIGDSTVTVDLHKNGVTVLSSVITLDNANTAYIKEAGTISSASVVVGDVLEVVTVATVGTGTLALGVFAALVIDEKAV